MMDPALLDRTFASLFANADVDDPRAEVWDALIQHGFAHPFQAGVTRWSEAAEILRASSRHAPGLPLAENVLGSWLESALDTQIVSRRYTLAAPSHAELVLGAHGVSGRARFVAHAAVSSHLFAEVTSAERERVLVVMELRGVEAHAGESIAGEPRDELVIRGAPVLARSTLAAHASPLEALGALARATQISAFADTVLALSLEHARTRTQFGAPIASFQAVQHQLAELACEVAALDAAVRAAEHVVDGVPSPLGLSPGMPAIATAKVQAGLAARVAARVGHAVHGAIGFTREHRLHRYTQRLLAYRAEYGAEREHAARLGARALARGASSWWNDVTAQGHDTPDAHGGES